MSNQDSRTSRTDTKIANVLNRIVDLGIVGVLFVAPLAMAGRFAPGRLLLAILVGVTAVAWFCSRVMSNRDGVNWLWTGAEWVAMLAVTLVVLQLLPWSPATLESLSPELRELLPLHTASAVSNEPASVEASNFETSLVADDAALAQPDLETNLAGQPAYLTWDQVSLAPHATRGGLAMAMIYTMLFFVILQRVRHRNEIERLLKAVALAGVFMASVGLAQYLLCNGKFLWFMEHPSRDTLTGVKGTFANENHFAHFLAMTLGPLLWWLVKEQSDSESSETDKPKFGIGRTQTSYSQIQVLLCIGIGIVFVAGLLTYSRGGLLVMMLAALSSTAMFVYQKRIGKRAVLTVAAAGLIALLAVFIHGQDILMREIGTLQDVSIESLDKDQGRRKIWTAVLSAVPDFAMLGSGVGSHRYVYPTYFSSKSSVQYTHAESGYLNVLLETGGPGLALLLVGIGFTGYWLVTALLRSETDEVRLLAVPLVSGFLVTVVHGVFDFNWYIPANMCLALIVAALGARLWDISKERGQQNRISVSNFSCCVFAGAVLIMSVFAVSHYTRPAKSQWAWHEFRAWSLASNGPGAGRQRTLGQIDISDPNTIARMIELLDETLKHDPANGRAHVRMAAMCLRQFELLQGRSENAMTLAQIRDAALSAGFETHEEMSEWVSRVVGDNRVYLDRMQWHCKQAMSHTPTEGKCYLYFAEVAFLDDAVQSSDYDLAKQAYAVRPYDASIQFAYGRQKLIAGETEASLKLWKDAFGRGDKVRKRIIAAVGFQAPPQEIVDVFQPDLEGLRDLFEYYRRRNFEPQMRFIGEKFVVELEKQAQLMAGEAAGKLWFDAQFVHTKLDNIEAAAEAAKNAVMSAPADYRNHYACALRMRDCGKWEEAIREFRWCASRKPDDTELPKVIRDIKSQALQTKALNAESIDSLRFSR